MTKRQGNGNGGDSSTALVRPEVVLRELLAKRMDRIAKAIPKNWGSGLTPESVCRAVMMAVSKNSDLLRCTGESIFVASLQAVQYGLEPGGALQEAALVPYGKVCTFQPMVRGLIALMVRHGCVKQIDAEAVVKGDFFEVERGLEPKLIHRPDLAGDPEAPIVAAYAVARLDDNALKFEVVKGRDITRAKNLARNSQAWQHWPEEMAKKVAIKRLAKRIALKREVADVIEHDNAIERGDAIELLTEGAPGAEAPATQTQTDRLKGKLRAEAEQREPGGDDEVDRTAEGEEMPGGELPEHMR